MKNCFNKIALALCFTTWVAQAQEFTGQATYQSKMNRSSFEIDIPNMPEESKKQIQEQMYKAFDKTYLLYFNKTESIFEEEQKLEAPTKTNSGIKVQNNGGNDINYCNTKSKSFLIQTELLNKPFLISDTLTTPKWELLSETKQIGNYTCYKAQKVKKVTQEQIKEYEELVEEQKKSKTNFMELKAPKDVITTAWYTPEIPVNHGPNLEWGLPGLILEIYDGSMSYLCTKITLNPKNKVEIKKPNKGKKVTQTEFNIIEEEKLNSLNDGNGNIQINIQK